MQLTFSSFDEYVPVKIENAFRNLRNELTSGFPCAKMYRKRIQLLLLQSANIHLLIHILKQDILDIRFFFQFLSFFEFSH